MARQLGGKTVRQWQNEMLSDEFVEWLAYEQLDPGDPERTDIRFGKLECCIRNLLRSRSEPYLLKDCVLDFGKDDGQGAPEPIPQDMLAKKLSMFKFAHDWALAQSGG